MNPFNSSRFAALFAAIGLVACGGGTTPTAGATAPTATNAPTGDDVAIVTLPNVDTSQLLLDERKNFSRVVQGYLSPCGEPISIATCVQESRSCKRCLPAAKSAAYLVSRGESAAEAGKYIEARYYDTSVKAIDLTGAPRLGPDQAPVKVVEFVDFECPHCAHAAPIIRSIVESKELAGKAALYYRGFPLQFHQRAEPAARAALAADLQGKFWVVSEKLFDKQDDLSDKVIESIIRDSKLDVDAWRTAWMSPAIAAAVVRDRDEGTMLGITGTPTFYINGRKFVGVLASDLERELRDWVVTEASTL